MHPKHQKTARQFNITETDYKGRNMTFVSIESEAFRMEDTNTVPADWYKQVYPHVKAADLVFTNYFMPELDETIMNSFAFGALAKSQFRGNLGVYDWLAGAAAHANKPVATAEIANRAAYMMYEVLPQLPFILSGHNGPFNPTPNQLERFLPSSTDARRMFAAAGIRRVAEDMEEGKSILYVAAPAHTKRVQKYTTQPMARVDQLRARIYNRSFVYLDKSVRIYKPNDDGEWSKVHVEPLNLEEEFS